jgi:ankyrin repeat protein
MGFDPNVLNENGYTPLQYAAMRGDPQMVELFLRNGASVSMLSKDGESAVELALKMDHGEAAEMLKNARQELIALEQAAKVALKKN